MGYQSLGQNEITVTATSGVQSSVFKNVWKEIIIFAKCYEHNIQLPAYKLFSVVKSGLCVVDDNIDQ